MSLRKDGISDRVHSRLTSSCQPIDRLRTEFLCCILDRLRDVIKPIGSSKMRARSRNLDVDDNNDKSTHNFFPNRRLPFVTRLPFVVVDVVVLVSRNNTIDAFVRCNAADSFFCVSVSFPFAYHHRKTRPRTNPIELTCKMETLPSLNTNQLIILCY